MQKKKEKTKGKKEDGEPIGVNCEKKNTVKIKQPLTVQMNVEISI